MLVLSDSSKHILQILQLLDERRLCLSVSINRKELIVMAGIGLLRQFVGVNRDSKLARESQRLLTTVVDQLERESSAAAAEFSAIANRLTCGDVGNTVQPTTANQEMPAPRRKSRSPQSQLLQSWKHRLSLPGKSPTTITATATTSPSANTDALSRRNTISGAQPPSSSPSSSSHLLRSSSSRTSLHAQSREDASYSSLHSVGLHHHSLPSSAGYDSSRAMSCSALTGSPVPTPAPAAPISMSEWEYVLGDMDRGYANIFNGIYGGRICGVDDGTGPYAALTAEYGRKMAQQQQQPPRGSITGPDTSFPFTAASDETITTAAVGSSDLPDLSPVAWSSSSGGGSGSGSGGSLDVSAGTHNGADLPTPTTHRVLSFSEESSLGSAEETSSSSSYGHYAMLDSYGDGGGGGGAVRLVALEDEFEGFGGLLEGWDRQLAV